MVTIPAHITAVLNPVLNQKIDKKIYTTVQKKIQQSKLMRYRVHNLLETHSQCYGMVRNPKLDRPAVPSCGRYAMIGKLLFRGGV